MFHSTQVNWTISYDFHKMEVKCSLKSRIISFCFCTNTEQKLALFCPEAFFSSTQQTVVFNAPSVLSLLLVATNPVALCLSVSLSLSLSVFLLLVYMLAPFLLNTS